MRVTIGVFCVLGALGCGEEKKIDGPAPMIDWQGRHVETLVFGSNDNSEIVKILPSGERAVLVASKSRKVTLLSVTETGLTELRSANLFPNSAADSELTHIDFDSQGRFAVVTRTKPETKDGTLVACHGSLVFLDVSDSDNFGTVLHEVEVGPMPDAVDISDDDQWVVSADEVDFNDDKCPLEAEVARVSILALPGGDPTAAMVRGIIYMDSDEGNPKREPEQIIFATDNDQVGVTLQDTHELMTFSVSALLGDSTEVVELRSGDVKITLLPNRSDGAEPWPDGIHRFVAANGEPYFIVAGEFNDTLHIFDMAGDFVSQHEIQPSDMPSDLPRNLEDWSKAPFRPDSLAPFTYGGHQYVAVSLKHAGAVGVWNVDDPMALTIASVVKVGQSESGTPTTESSLGTEGITATPDGTRIITANEDESSASLVSPF